MKKCWGVKAGSVGESGVSDWLALMSPGGCGQAGSEEVKQVPRNSQEKSQKHESVLTYLQRTEHNVRVTLQKQITVCLYSKTKLMLFTVSSLCQLHLQCYIVSTRGGTDTAACLILATMKEKYLLA